MHPQLDGCFARELPELAVPAQAQTAPDPRLLVLNEPLAVELGLDPEWLRSPAGIDLLTGTVLPDGATPVAQAYAGHQFGNYVPLLGDGRAMLLGELGGRDLALKGSGPTRFARGGDGLAAVGPMLREYIVSEAMHALGIPTTRSLAVLATGRSVARDLLLPGAVLVRVAASHLRVGSFQLAAQHADAVGDLGLLRRLADHAITRHYPQAAAAENPYLALFEAVVDAQAALVARWMQVGFVHGVMNTDNMTISGETIDYGPCAFMEAYDPATVFSSIDHGGRYAYGNQPRIAQWNLARLAEALLPLIAGDQDRAVELAEPALHRFLERYQHFWSVGMTAKFGLREPDSSLIDEALTLMQADAVDFTVFFRELSASDRLEYQGFEDWERRWRALGPDRAAMDRVNPIYIARNHLVEGALEAVMHDDLAPLQALLDALAEPFRPRAGLESYALPAPPEFGAYRTFCGT